MARTRFEEETAIAAMVEALNEFVRARNADQPLMAVGSLMDANKWLTALVVDAHTRYLELPAVAARLEYEMA